MIKEHWEIISDKLDSEDEIRLRSHLDRSYKETKITFPAFTKIMKFYIDKESTSSSLALNGKKESALTDIVEC